jgi:cobalamin biosynthesis protein CobD/CbiB
MTLFSLIVTFLLEQRCPLDYARWVARPVAAWAGWLERHLNAGGYQQGIFAVLLGVLPPLLLLGLLYFTLRHIHPLFALALNVLVLYLTMGFRQFSHSYTDIQLALRLGDVARARQVLAAWRGEEENSIAEDAGEISRLAIETALQASHRHVFAVLFWFVLLPGPLGAALYRLTHLIAGNWRTHDTFGRFALNLFRLIDWLPVRATAMAFAVVGNFTDAVYCWRNQASRWYDPELGIVFSSGAGALGVRLGTRETFLHGELGMGETANADFMQSAVGLVWRAIVLWFLLLFLLGLARLAG